MKATRSPIRAVVMVLAVSSLLLAPFNAYGAQIGKEQIQRILGLDANQMQSVLGGSLPTNEQLTARMLDRLATSATRELGKGSNGWNTSSNPKWTVVFNRVRSDLETDKSLILSSWRSASKALGDQYIEDIASEMKPTDVDKILSYYDSPEGSRYEAFLHRINAVFVSGELIPFTNGRASSAVKKPTSEELKQYSRMVRLSSLFQSVAATAQIDSAAHRDTSGYEAIGFIAGAAINRNTPELESLNQKYASDLSAFEAFGKSEPPQNFYRAMADAGKKLSASSSNPDKAALNAAMKKRGAEWRALYENQISN